MEQSIAVGREALTHFFNASKKFTAFNYSFDQMLEIIAGGPKAVQHFLDGVGTAIIEIQKDDFLTGNRVKTAMTKLADVSKGQLPAKAYFYSALSTEAANVTFVQALPSVVSGTAKELVKGAQEIGNTLIDTGKILNMLFPFVTIAAILFIVLKQTNRVAGNSNVSNLVDDVVKKAKRKLKAAK